MSEAEIKYNFEGFDPLRSTTSLEEENRRLINQGKRRQVQNILDSYTGYFDLFSEMVQNSLDACEKRWRNDNSYEPQIRIDISFSENSISVSDNGIGMNKREFEFCLSPNITFKSDENLRGQKGVGATFLAYGYNNLKIHTKRNQFEAEVMLLNGRNWVEDKSGDLERPKFKPTKSLINSFLKNKASGSVFKVTLNDGERPNLKYLSAYTASQWKSILRIKTPLGGVYLTNNNDDEQFKPSVTINVIDFEGEKSTVKINGAEYYYPHEIPFLRAKSVDEIEKQLSNIPGSPDEKYDKISDDYKRLNAVYEVWNWEELKEGKAGIAESFDEEKIDMIVEHKISVYGFFCNSTRIFDRFNDDILEIRKKYRILRGGLQIASDNMPQGDLITIPLTRYIGYQEQTHVIVHFNQGKPDLGRKTFQKEKKELAEKLSKNVVDALKRYRSFLKADETGEPLTPDKEKHDWIKSQERYYDNNGLDYPSFISHTPIISEPQKEQDVIALFHELVGMNVLKGLEFYATSEHKQYDSVFKLNYKESDIYYSENNPLGISNEIVRNLPFESEPKILEYKYDFDALVRECLSGEKFHKHIDLVVAWDASLRRLDKVELKSILIGERGRHNRTYFGSTHQAYLSGHYDQAIYEVILLKDLFNFLISSEKEENRQRKRYIEI